MHYLPYREDALQPRTPRTHHHNRTSVQPDQRRSTDVIYYVKDAR